MYRKFDFKHALLITSNGKFYMIVHVNNNFLKPIYTRCNPPLQSPVYGPPLCNPIATLLTNSDQNHTSNPAFIHLCGLVHSVVSGNSALKMLINLLTPLNPYNGIHLGIVTVRFHNFTTTLNSTFQNRVLLKAQRAYVCTRG